MVAEYWCRPRRYTVVEMGRTRASGTTRGPEVVLPGGGLPSIEPGGLFSIQVAEPAPP